MYNREQEEESKNRAAMFGGNGSNKTVYIKKEPSLLDDVVYEGSMTSSGLYVNPLKNIQQLNESSRSSLHQSSQQGVSTIVNNRARYPDRHANTEQAQVASRPSVIRNLNVAREQDQTFLQFESKMLKFHGDILRQTGDLFNYHADILDQHIMQQPDIIQEPKTNIVIQDSPEVKMKAIFKQEDNEMRVIKKEDTFSSKNEIKSPINTSTSTNNPNKIFLETEDLLENSAWAMAMDKYLDKDLELNLDVFIDDALRESKATDEDRNETYKDENSGTKNYDIDRITDLHFTKDDDLPNDVDASFAPRSSGYISVIQGPEMVFSTEELNLLSSNKRMHKGICRSTYPVNLHQARVGHYLGKISTAGMMGIFAAGRKAQNYYHYMSMASQPFFSDLTTRWVHKLH